MQKEDFYCMRNRRSTGFFANGDFFTLAKTEIAEATVTFYDELRVGEGGFCPIAKSGFIKCKISSKRKHKGEQMLYKNSEYGKDIKEYLENRCVKEGGIHYVRLFDRNHWHVPFYCIADARREDEFLILEFQGGVGCGAADKDHHIVRARNITKKNVEKILLDFENCDSIEIFAQEIQDIQLHFENELYWGSSAFFRQVRNGYIRLKFDKEITRRRSNVNWMLGKDAIKRQEKRLYGKGKDVTDICHLYVTYDYAGYCMKLEECIDIKDIRPIKEQEADEWNYISGYAEKQKDGSVLIVFGK